MSSHTIFHSAPRIALCGVFSLAWLLGGSVSTEGPVGTAVTAAQPPPKGGGASLTIKGQLLPTNRLHIFTPAQAKVVEFAEFLKPGATVQKGQELILMFSRELARDIGQMQGAIGGAEQKIALLQRQIQDTKNPAEKINLQTQLAEARAGYSIETQKLREKRELFNADLQKPGHFRLRSPLRGAVLSSDFREKFTSQVVQPNQPLLRIAEVEGPWEIQLPIPQQHIGQVLKALDQQGGALDVALVLVSAPRETSLGRLMVGNMAREVRPAADGKGEPSVLASIRVDDPQIPNARRIPQKLRLAGTEVDCTFPGIVPAKQKAPEVPRKPAPPQAGLFRQLGLVQIQPAAIEKVPVLLPGRLVRLAVQESQAVRKGVILAEFSSLSLGQEELTARGQLQHQTALVEAYGELLAKTPQKEERDGLKKKQSEAVVEREAARRRLETLAEHRKNLLLTAPRDGCVMGLPRVDEVFKTWELKDLETPFCSIGDPTKLRVLVPFAAADYERLRTALKTTPAQQQKVTIRLRNEGALPWKGQVSFLPEAVAKTIPHALSTRGGGPLAVKPASQPKQLEPQSPVYLVGIHLDAGHRDVYPGAIVEVEIQCSGAKGP